MMMYGICFLERGSRDRFLSMPDVLEGVSEGSDLAAHKNASVGRLHNSIQRDIFCAQVVNTHKVLQR